MSRMRKFFQHLIHRCACGRVTESLGLSNSFYCAHCGAELKGTTMDIPISINPDMIPAIRAGLKTQFRKVSNLCDAGDVLVTHPGGLRLLVKQTRSERLQDIAQSPRRPPVGIPEDLAAEGIHFTGEGFKARWMDEQPARQQCCSPVAAFCGIWNGGHDALGRYGWDQNPMVHVITFRYLESDEDEK